MSPTLFQSLSFGKRTARNRILFGSHATNLARNQLLSQQHADYYAARAAGGAGIIVLEEHIVHPSDLPYESALAGYLAETPQALAKVVPAIQEHGALALVQLNHNGQQASSDYHQRELWAPSPVPNVSSREVPKQMEQEDIDAVIAGFARVARFAVEAGADGIELQVADSSLLRQFLSPLTNQRSDDYGGSLENRMRFLMAVLQATHQEVAPADAVLGLRFCADELAPWAGLTPEQTQEIARLLAAANLIDYMTITMGSILSTHMFPFHASMHAAPGYAVHVAALIKEVVPFPVFAAGRIMDAAQAEAILAAGQADGVEMIRPLIADPQLPRLSQAGQSQRVRPCIACNQGCQVRSITNVAIGCNVNPDVLHISSLENMRTPTLPQRRQQVWVIGSGPGGLEAARTAALRGRSVVVYERSGSVGGTVSLAATAPGRGELQAIITYLHNELRLLDVEIHTDTEVSVEMVRAQAPHAVIVATGATPGNGILPIAGHDLPHVYTLRSLLQGQVLPGKQVVVIDETDSHGLLSTIELMATQGKQVTVVSEAWYVGLDLAATHDIVPWMQRALALGVTLLPHTTVLRIEEDAVVVSNRFSEQEERLPATAVVLGTYDRPDQQLYLALKGQIPRLFRVGDCVTPRRIEHAIAEGRLAGLQV